MYFLNVNKPKGLTSFDVIRALRKKLNIRQIGHSGTLDPLAYGVMQVAVGDCTRLLDYLESDKTYIAKIKFGYTTQTYDSEGEKKFIKTPDFTYEQLIQKLNSFCSKIMQTPPLYSAIKIKGKKSCDIIRKNPSADISIPEREVEIYSIKLLDFNSFDEARIEVFCSKGTYIRSLANDLGQALGCGAYLADLERIQAGNFKIQDSNLLTDEKFREINPLDVLKYDKIELDDNEFKKISNGNNIANKTYLGNDRVVLLTKNNKLVSVANLSDNLIKPKKIFRSNFE